MDAYRISGRFCLADSYSWLVAGPKRSSVEDLGESAQGESTTRDSLGEFGSIAAEVGTDMGGSDLLRDPVEQQRRPAREMPRFRSSPGFPEIPPKPATRTLTRR